eukprot:7762821-Pyramimonas_sp.AAC.1
MPSIAPGRRRACAPARRACAAGRFSCACRRACARRPSSRRRVRRARVSDSSATAVLRHRGDLELLDAR